MQNKQEEKYLQILLFIKRVRGLNGLDKEPFGKLLGVSGEQYGRNENARNNLYIDRFLSICELLKIQIIFSKNGKELLKLFPESKDKNLAILELIRIQKKGNANNLQIANLLNLKQGQVGLMLNNKYNMRVDYLLKILELLGVSIKLTDLQFNLKISLDNAIEK